MGTDTARELIPLVSSTKCNSCKGTYKLDFHKQNKCYGFLTQSKLLQVQHLTEEEKETLHQLIRQNTSLLNIFI